MSRNVGSCCTTAPSHNAATAQQVLDNRKVSELLYPLYSPDLAATSSFLFPKLRFALKCQHFQLITEIKGAVTTELISIIKETWLAGVKNFVNMQIHPLSVKF
jgi:hypothetical protein